MSNNKDYLIDKFDSEALKMWNDIGSDEEYMETYNQIVGKKVQKPVVPKINREDIIKLRENSLKCVEIAKNTLNTHLSKEQYYKANEMRIAGILHQNFADRLERILQGLPIFIVK